MTTRFFFLGLPSALVWLALLAHLTRSRGWRRAAAFTAAAAVYGALRWAFVQAITTRHFGTAAPYLMAGERAGGGLPPLQEILGWAVAAGYAWLGAEQLLLRCGIRPGPFRLAAIASLVLAAISFAVESAAIRSGWWSWTLSTAGGAGHVPLIGLVDWSFVAFDFLAPYLAFTAGASWRARGFSLALFPVHFFSHTMVRPLDSDFPFTGFDLIHVGIVTAVGMLAIRETGKTPAGQRQRAWMPAIGLFVIAAATAAAILYAGGGAAALAAVPLGLLAAAALPFFPLQARAHGGRTRKILSMLLVATAAAFLLFVRLPAQRRLARFESLLRSSVAHLSQGDLAAAQSEAEEVVELRPDRAIGRTMLAIIHLRGRQTEIARQRLDEALIVEPYDHDALVLAITLDIANGRRDSISQLAARGRLAFPDNPEFSWAAAFARGEAGSGLPAHEESLSLAAKAVPPGFTALERLAAAAGDRATAERCRQGR